MGIRVYKPTSNGRRNSMVSDFKEITDRKKKPEKALLKPRKKTGGRNFQGKITSRHIGGGAKRMYRLIDFKRNKDDVVGTITHIEYDPNRTCRIALVQYADGEKRYILAPEGVSAGSEIMSGLNAEPKVGNCMPLERFRRERRFTTSKCSPAPAANLCRSAGISAVMNAREGSWAQITLPSGEVRRLPAKCRATIGAIGNSRSHEHRHRQSGPRAAQRPPAARSRLGHEPDRPPDGGRRRSPFRRPAPVSPTGKLAKGGKTRKPRKPSSKAIIRRRKSRRYGQLKV